MLKIPAQKYRAVAPIALADRSWPNCVLSRPPIWLSTDLRDGNQALLEPMNVERKLQMFRLLVGVGFKEIEVAFPSASQTEHAFVRRLIEDAHVPSDVEIGVLTQAREHLIRATMESLRNAKRAIVHVYNPTAPSFRKTVLNRDRAGVIELAVTATRLIKQLSADQPETSWRLEYSPETFTTTELDFAKDICDAVVDAWSPPAHEPVIINLPATVEVSSPNCYADQIEWMHRNLARRNDVILSVHPHNDRGCAVAAAELAMMAGAERVEGTLFGNGERTGNVDLVTLALNFYSQGIDPRLDFSDINSIARAVEHCNQLPIHPRHPYVGDLVFTAFSGSHQDAIKKGMAAQTPGDYWDVPYLPVDPADVGRTYDSIIRVNSQSGKGGVAYLLEAEHGLMMPRRLQIELSSAVQTIADTSGTEVTANEIWRVFRDEYISSVSPLEYLSHQLTESGSRREIVVEAKLLGKLVRLRGSGTGPIDALLDALSVDVQLYGYEQRALQKGSAGDAVVFVEISVVGGTGAIYGVGIHANIATASVLSVFSGLNRAYARESSEIRSRLFARVQHGNTYFHTVASQSALGSALQEAWPDLEGDA